MLACLFAGCRVVSLPAGTCADNSACFVGEVCCSNVCVAMPTCPSVNAATDAGADSGADAGPDAGVDAGPDAGVDAGADAGFDAGADAGFDAGPRSDCVWGDASTITVNASISNFTAKIAPTGDAVMAWTQYDASANNVLATRMQAAATTWSAPARLNPYPDSAGSPSIAFDTTGTATVVWQDYISNNNVLDFVRLQPSSSSWPLATLAFASGFTTPKIVADGRGNIHSISLSNTGYYTSHRFDVDSGVWSAAGIAGQQMGGYSGFEFVQNADGVGAFVNERWYLPIVEIWANLYVPDAGWETLSRIDTGDAGRLQNARTAIDSAGNVVVIWEREIDAGRYELVWNAKAAYADWQTTKPVQAAAAYNQNGAQITARTAESFYATWTESNGVPPTVARIARYTADGGLWGDAGTFSDGGSVSNRRVGIDGAGNVVVVWLIGAPKVLWYRRLLVDAGWSPPTLMESASITVWDVELDVSENGNIIIAWNEQPNAGQQVIGAMICR